VGDSPTTIGLAIEWLQRIIWTIIQWGPMVQALYKWWKPSRCREESVLEGLFDSLERLLENVDLASGRLVILHKSLGRTDNGVNQVYSDHRHLTDDLDGLREGQREAAEILRSLGKDRRGFWSIFAKIEGIQNGLEALTAKVDGLTRVEEVKGCDESAPAEAEDVPTVDRLESTGPPSDADAATPPTEAPTQTEGRSELADETVSEDGTPAQVLAAEEGDSGRSSELVVTQDPAPAPDSPTHAPVSSEEERVPESSPAQPVFSEEELVLESTPEQSVLTEEQTASSTEQAVAHDSAPTEGLSATTEVSTSSPPAGSTDEASCFVVLLTFGSRLLTFAQEPAAGPVLGGQDTGANPPLGIATSSSAFGSSEPNFRFEPEVAPASAQAASPQLLTVVPSVFEFSAMEGQSRPRTRCGWPRSVPRGRWRLREATEDAGAAATPAVVSARRMLAPQSIRARLLAESRIASASAPMDGDSEPRFADGE
jgi:hypothetical protein